MNFENFKQAIQGRPLFIWGTRTLGIAVLNRLKFLGINPVGFIDSIKRAETLNDIPILSSNDFFSRHVPGSCLILICTQAYAETISSILLQHNFTTEDFFNYNDLVHLHYYIETNNRCNLRCKTCSVPTLANSDFHNMDFAFFQKVVDKIIAEDPFVANLFLYGSNEPLLSPDFAEKILYCKAKGLCVGLSTNLTPNADYEKFVKSQPDWVRISVSGWGENYEQMHRGGKFELLLAHMHLLSALRDEYAPKMVVDVIFHRYKHNLEDIPRMQALCKSLGFQFSCINAAIIGLDAVSAYLEHRPIPRAMRECLPLLCHSVEELAQKAFEERNQPCVNESVLRIASDGSMNSCQCRVASIIENANFSTMHIQDIVQTLKSSPMCAYCKKNGLHTFYQNVFDESTNDD